MKKNFILLLFIICLVHHGHSQNTLTGTVIDAQNKTPLVGATISIKGSISGTAADVDGKFQLKTPANATLLVSFIGYQSKEVIYTGQTSLIIGLSADVSAIDEVVVVGYGTQKKSHLTGAISKVSNEKLGQIPVARADEALIGKVAGVSIQVTDAKAGASPTIRVRGTGSITASSSPLIVMDGVAVSSDYLGSIDMNDVESIEVLKDASSAAIYGSRGGNGVIMITTKQGKEGKTKFSFNSFYGSKFTAKYQTRPTIANWTQAVSDYNSGNLTNEAKLINLLGTETNWTDVMFDGGAIQNYSLSATGGNDKTKFSISGGYLSDDGVLLTDSYKKMNLRINLDTKVNNVLEFGGNINPSYTSQRDFAIGIHDAIRQSPWLPLYIDENNIQYVNKTKYPLVQVGDYAYEVYFDGYVLPGNAAGTTISSTTNESALAKVQERETYNYNFRLFTNVYAKLNIAKDLAFKASVAAEYNNLQTDRWVGNKLLSGTAGTSSTYNTNLYTHLVSENIFTYNKAAGKHSFGAVAGLAWEKSFVNSSGETGTGFKFDNIHTLNAATTIASATTYKSEESLQSIISRFNYAFGDKYLISFSARWDGSSRFGVDTKYGFFPAASVGWRVTEEDFLKGNKLVSNLKARFSYGVSGNNAVGPYDAIARLQAVNAVFGGSATSGFNPANIANPKLGWEKSVELGPGIDLGLWDNKLTFSFDYYNRTSKDLLLNQEIPSVTGFNTTTVNIGKVRNNGFEIELTGHIVNTKNLIWTASANLSHNKNELVDFAGANGLISSVDSKRPSEYIALEGNPISSFYGYLYEKEVPNKYLTKPLYPIGADSQDCYVKDISGPNGVPDGIITSDDRTILGSPYPTWIWGLTNQFTCMDFDLSFTLQGSHGAKVRNMDPQYLNNQFSTTMDYVSTFPDKALVREKIYTDKFVQDASYVALRTINLGYTLPKATANRMGISSIRIYASGQNLFYHMADSYTSFNPEGVTDASSPLRGGYQVGAAPISKAITFGVNLEF
jgi:TonB-linked SusC/RagA family outer membrane protein